ncbi:MAG TPA: exodeoxyribonuclease VII [Fervidobacterium sp.]|nr:exodeoxyribonuclease VII [Fervidobacterium sp.]HOK87370.1 exodeoxyribonuclease VII [Fervidobacterium sp.]HOM73616.1 exodeoxyribonuclease VII [Fervidobacterium sp.]HOQ39902.1 exodeoxyribonuclease VII [Fervidobacterium sp.]HPT54394.1 exodeoxyribonuclease VII [Fervidobacterium sp.]
MDLEDILKLEEEEIEKLKFKELMEMIDFIKTSFVSTDLDVEVQIKLYSKAIILLMKAREKLSAIKKQKEEIDKMYEEFVRKMDQ